MPTIEGAQRPFWMHQLVEYLIGLVLIGASFQALEPAVPAVLGALVMLNAAVAKGGASAFPIVSRRVHRWLDVVVMSLLVVGAFQPAIDVDLTGRLLLCGMAVVLLFIWLNSDFSSKPERAKRKASMARPESEEIGRRAGRAVGGGVNAAKRLTKKMRDD